jgi:hypothetical protein
MSDKSEKSRPKQRRTAKLEVPLEPGVMDDALLKAKLSLPEDKKDSSTLRRVRAVMRTLLKHWISGKIELDEEEIEQEEVRAKKRNLKNKSSK